MPLNLTGILIATGHLWLAGGRSLFAILELTVLATIFVASMLAIEKRLPHFWFGEPKTGQSPKRDPGKEREDRS